MSIVPRRSPRFTAPAPASTFTKEQSRDCFQKNLPYAYILITQEIKDEFISTVKQYLDRVDAIKNNRAGKARIVIPLCEYMIQQPLVLAAYPQLTSVIRKKMEDFQTETIRNREVNEAFQKAVADLLFVVS